MPLHLQPFHRGLHPRLAGAEAVPSAGPDHRPDSSQQQRSRSRFRHRNFYRQSQEVGWRNNGLIFSDFLRGLRI